MTILIHLQYNRTSQQPNNNVPIGSIFQCSPLLGSPCKHIVYRDFYLAEDGWGTDSENVTLIPEGFKVYRLRNEPGGSTPAGSQTGWNTVSYKPLTSSRSPLFEPLEEILFVMYYIKPL
jgi:hypothetical protein